jgi:hypothetical protein
MDWLWKLAQFCVLVRGVAVCISVVNVLGDLADQRGMCLPKESDSGGTFFTPKDTSHFPRCWGNLYNIENFQVKIPERGNLEYCREWEETVASWLDRQLSRYCKVVRDSS